MDKRLKAKWVKALRGGDYEQGRRVLKSDEEAPIYCCLGVLCEVAKVKFDGWDSFLPGDFAKKIGLGATDAYDEDENPIQVQLANWNDGAEGKKRWSFKKIASWIEKTKLF